MTLDEMAAALVEEGTCPDAALGIAVRVGTRWEVETGCAATVDGRVRIGRGVGPGMLPFDPIFDLASVTKPMTALAIARSSLARAAPLASLLDEAAGTASEEVPLELLLAHRVGLEAHVSLYEPLVTGGLIDRAHALRAAASARRADAVGALPAEGFAPVYSDLGYVLAGAALARREGARDAGEAIERFVARPLGCDDQLGTARSLSERGIDFERRVRPTEVVGWRGGVVSGKVHDENAWALTGEGGSGHAGLFGTALAVLAFGRAVFEATELGEGRFSDDGEDLRWLVRPRPGGTLRAGFDGKSATGSSAGNLAGPRTFGHLGFTGTSVWIDPDAEVVVAMLTNRVHPTRDNLAIRLARPRVHDALFALGERRRARALP